MNTHLQTTSEVIKQILARDAESRIPTKDLHSTMVYGRPTGFVFPITNYEAKNWFVEFLYNEGFERFDGKHWTTQTYESLIDATFKHKY